MTNATSSSPWHYDAAVTSATPSFSLNNDAATTIATSSSPRHYDSTATSGTSSVHEIKMSRRPVPRHPNSQNKDSATRYNMYPWHISKSRKIKISWVRLPRQRFLQRHKPVNPGYLVMMTPIAVWHWTDAWPAPQASSALRSIISSF